MIFITLGSQKFQFNRLLKAVDNLIENGIIKDSVFAQIGYSDYCPLHYKYVRFLDRENYLKMEMDSEIVLTHGGTGAIIGAVKNGKKVIAVPRLAKYGEHVDDHQTQLLLEFEQMGIISPCYDIKDLAYVYKNINNIRLKPYISRKNEILNSIDDFLSKI